MKIKYFSTVVFLLLVVIGFAQSTAKINPRPLTADEYKKAKTFKVADLDKDTYVKFENKYVLDRYEMRKPYLITGDDGLKKRIDLYKLLSKDSMQEIGLMIYYTNERGNLFAVVQPSVNSDANLWEQYFEDIHTIDKIEKNFVLKLSYVLSKEMSFQLYKGLNKNIPTGGGTYGTEICFPGDQWVTMADGGKKYLKDIRQGDRVMSIDPHTKALKPVLVRELTSHAADNYAVTRLLLVAVTEKETKTGILTAISSKIVEATPNHPVRTTTQNKKIGEVIEGDQLICYDELSGKHTIYTVQYKTEIAGKKQEVYNIVAAEGETLLINNVMVMQK